MIIISVLQLLPEAEAAFLQVLKLDRNCDDAMQELMRVRSLQLTVSSQHLVAH